MRPSSGTGHSTSPATSASRPRIGTTSSPSAAARAAMPVSMIRSRSAASTTTKRSRSAARPVGEGLHREGLGAGQEAVALGQVGGGQAMHRVLAVAQREAAPAGRRARRGCAAAAAPRRSRWLPQRMDFGQGKPRSSGGQLLGDQRRGRHHLRPASRSTQNWPSWVSCSRRRAMLAEEAVQRLRRAR